MSALSYLSTGVNTVPEAVKIIQANAAPQVVKSLGYNEDIYMRALKKCKLPAQYHNPSQDLTLIDFHNGFSPYTYYMNRQLNPKKHLMFPRNQASCNYWEKLAEVDPTLSRNTVIDRALAGRSLKHYLLTDEQEEESCRKADEGGKDPNQSILITGNFADRNGDHSLRMFLYFNKVCTSVFRYGRVKMLAWANIKDILKFMAMPGSGHRRSNSLMAELYTDMKIHAWSNFSKNKGLPGVVDVYGQGSYEIPTRHPLYGDLALVEFQSNYSKYNIEYPIELNLIIHTLSISPSRKVKDCVNVLGAGAAQYFPTEVDDEILNKTIAWLTADDYITLSEAYYNWPFKPDAQFQTYYSGETKSWDTSAAD